LTCCCSTFGSAAERQFNEKKAAEELARFRANGPGPTTRLLLEGLQKSGTLNGRLLDIGSGIGSLTFELLELGVVDAIAVDASSAYIAAATEEAERRHRAHEIRFVHGDFVEVASTLPSANVVTLDRVVCCYPSADMLMTEALAHAAQCLALSYPRDVWYVRAGILLENGGRWFKGNAFRTFVHSSGWMERQIREAGFELVSRRATWMWCADVYVRT
jgi:SAM-dependent methyltransferase